MSIKRKTPELFEGVRAEEYKRIRNKWIRLEIIGAGIPFLMSILVSIFNDTFNVLDLFKNGEIILLMFSLNLPMAFDIFDAKKREDEGLSRAFWGCIVIICLQVALYCLIKMENSEENAKKNIPVSALMMVASWGNCVYSIRAMFLHSIAENGGEKNVD